jgi:1-acyl-sn-glycerol-3-phosphate acyltransferase
MFDKISLKLSTEQKLKRDTVFEQIKKRYHGYKDPWGFNLDTVETAMNILLPAYFNYFKVRVFGAENIQDRPYIFVSNHTGQVPIDASLISIAVAMEAMPPRILHGMVDRFVYKMPFLGDWYSQIGAIMGDRKNSIHLLDKGESILVFPEGVKGVSKNTLNFYKLQKFTNGFYRIALSKKVAIIPVSVIGAEEMFPLVFHTKFLSRQLGVPSIPLMSNYFPLPSPIDIYFGKPIEVADINPDAPDKDIRPEIYKIEKVIKHQIKMGLDNRRPFFDPVRKPLQNFLLKVKDDL